MCGVPAPEMSRKAERQARIKLPENVGHKSQASQRGEDSPGSEVFQGSTSLNTT